MLCGTIPNSEMNDLGRVAAKECPVKEIRIFGENDKVLTRRELPNRLIACSCQIEIRDML